VGVNGGRYDPSWSCVTDDDDATSKCGGTFVRVPGKFLA